LEKDSWQREKSFGFGTASCSTCVLGGMLDQWRQQLRVTACRGHGAYFRFWAESGQLPATALRAGTGTQCAEVTRRPW